ncbi:lipid II flippase MurJ [Microcoleus sp. AT3-D2]|uniref:lipid II flippase MurJ n=1 Tax=Microcoleus sp. AT3-D2 TaxID=2818612 RepID=UPI002FD35231
MKILSTQKLLDFWHQQTSGSVNRQIFGAAVTVALGTIIVKAVALVKELVVAWKFGTGDTLDAFLIALLVPAFITNVVSSSFNAALIPTYIRVRDREGTNAAQRLFSGATVWIFVVLAIATILMVVTAPIYLPLIAGGFSREKLDLTFKLLCAIAPVVLLETFMTSWRATLNAGERFALVALAPIFTPIMTILLLLVLHSWGIFNLAAGLVFGVVLEMVAIGISLHQQGISLMPKWYGFDPHLRQVASQYIPAVTGALLMNTAAIVDQSMAAMLSPGSVASLNYGNRVIALPITLIATALSTAVIPYFSKMVAREDWANVRHTLNRYLGLIFALTVPLTGFLILFSELIVQLLFQRGSFTANDTHLVAQIQFCFAFQIPFYIGNILLARLMISMRLNYILMRVSAFNLMLNITLNYIFMQWIGIKGIALSTSFVYLFSFLYMFVSAQQNLRKITGASQTKSELM